MGTDKPPKISATSASYPTESCNIITRGGELMFVSVIKLQKFVEHLPFTGNSIFLLFSINGKGFIETEKWTRNFEKNFIPEK